MDTERWGYTLSLNNIPTYNISAGVNEGSTLHVWEVIYISSYAVGLLKDFSLFWCEKRVTSHFYLVSLTDKYNASVAQ